MTTPLPTDDHDRPAWWRNRRRWFYIVVIGVPLICLIGGGGLWYRWNFPLPASWTAYDPTDPFQPVPNPVLHWVRSRQIALIHWKSDRVFSKLNLPGSAWEDPETGLVIEFGADGKLRMLKLPEPSPVSGPAKAGWVDLMELEGMAYVINASDRDLYGLVESGWSYASLQIGDRPNFSPGGYVPARWFGRLKTEGDNLVLNLRQMVSNHSIAPSEFTLVRRSHADAEP